MDLRMSTSTADPVQRADRIIRLGDGLAFEASTSRREGDQRGCRPPARQLFGGGSTSQSLDLQ
jgi:hypothetical protein